ncbi:MAG: GNAT family N-acetyltransferase [Muribaculaceae bacterium]|nr:GNAT family N-acetyltransferase [Muribaculaceae bacterium]
MDYLKYSGEQSADGASVVKLYRAAFPRSERRPWPDLVDKLRTSNGVFNLDCWMNYGSFVGFISYWLLDDVVYVEHFAVEDRYRGCGMGADILRCFKERFPDRPIVLEVEKPFSNDMASRRIGFYRRHGFEVVSTEYLQPPYHEDEDMLPLDLMATAPIDVPRVSRLIHTNVYGVDE